MSRDDIQAAIETALENRKAAVVNRNAIKALFAAFSDPISALGQIFLGRGDAIDAEKQRLQQEALLDLVCRIDEALSTALAALNAGGASQVVVQGLIETNAIDAKIVTGVDVASNSGPVEFKPGTHIRTSGIGVGSLTGLRIGGDQKDGQ